MKPNPRGSSSEVDRARAAAERLSREGEAAPAPESLGYIRFSARRFGTRPAAADTASVPPPAPEPAPEPELPQLIEMAPPAAEPEIHMEAETAPEPVGEPEDLIEQLVAEVEEEQPPPWAQVLENCVAVAQARAGLIVDPAGRILAASAQLPKAKLEAIAGRLMQILAGIGADPSLHEALRAAAVQLGAFWLTGLRVPLGPEHVNVGLLAAAELGPDVLPRVEAEARRGAL